jgi:Flp pilus assembly protein TadG
MVGWSPGDVAQSPEAKELFSARAGLRRGRGDDGAALVEFAFIAPVLIAVALGIIEFGWMFGQHLDVRHGAREAARLAAVNYRTGGATGSTQSDQIIDTACNRMNFDDNVSMTLSFSTASTTRGSEARIVVTKPVQQITGFYSFILNSVDLRSDVRFQLEQNATWVAKTKGCP